MYPEPFQYERANSVDDALSLLDEHADRETTLLAGGHSLLPIMKAGLASPDVVIDIGRIEELRGIERNDDSVHIGALTPYAAIERFERGSASFDVVAAAASEIGDVQVRTMGTIGGNIAHADPASDMPASVLAADATVHVHGQDGTRSIDATDFFQGMFTTAMDDDELLTGIDVPSSDADAAGAYVKRPSPSSGYAIVGVAAVLEGVDTINAARVAVTGGTDYAVRLPAVEERIVGKKPSEALFDEAAEHATDDLNGASLVDDAQASSAFRAQLLEQYTARALSAAAKQT